MDLAAREDLRRSGVVRFFAPALVLFAALAAPPARAQVNIDQDKTPAHIWASDCAVCHKSMRGLANGRGSSSLTEFLAEHYTSNQQEAAALAAYVLAGGGGSGKPVPVRGEQPDHTQAAGEPPKEQGRRPPKPDEERAAGAKPVRHPAARGKPEPEERSASAEPAPVRGEQKPPSDRRKPSPVARTHERPTPATAVPPKPERAEVAAAPKPVEAPKPDVSPPAASPAGAAPQEAPPSEASPPPSDNIPD
jgi:hypothetical protein